MRWTLPSDRVPEAWFNVAPHLPAPARPAPASRRRASRSDPTTWRPLFPMALIAQEVTAEPWIDMPGPVLDILRLWRPTPLVRARRLEEALGTPARIYYKDESVSPAGSHKPNTAVPQAFFNKAEGVNRLTTETGAGQWGSALSLRHRLFDQECKVYMVRASYDQKPYRRVMMETWGGNGRPLTGRRPRASRFARHGDQRRGGRRRGAGGLHYSLGSVLNHVLLHQTVIGLEAKEQLRRPARTGPTS